MPRPLHFNKPTHKELRQLLLWLESNADARVRQRIEIILALCTLPTATEVAQLCNLHLNTVLQHVWHFNRHRLRWITTRHQGGPPRQISQRVVRQIVALANQSPSALGLPYGTWSLARLQWFLVKRRKLVRHISREHLRRLLKKTAFIFGASNARSTVKTRGAVPFWLGFLGRFDSSHRARSCSLWTRKDPSPSSAMAARFGALPRRW
jgi:hypothetical protein